MAKTTKKDFKEFQKEFMKYVELFGLKGYSVFFGREEINGGHAEIRVNIRDRVATVVLSTEKHEKHFQTMRDCAKHEALHLLIARLEDLAKRRYVTPGDINEECEGIVEILEKSIP